jgi:dUTP pyrophosphatase
MDPAIGRKLEVQLLPHYEGLGMPKYATSGSAGLDLVAAISDPLPIGPSERALVQTGIALSIPSGFEGQIRPRSGLANTYGLTVLNSPGTIDSDYRGEVKVLIINLGSSLYTIVRGDRIAQLAICPVETVELVEVSQLISTERADSGFGHSDHTLR